MNVVSAYMLDFVFFMHGRFIHIGINTMKKLVKCDMIYCNVDELNKCEICIKFKMTRQSFHNIERNVNLLDFVHSNICELNGM